VAHHRHRLARRDPEGDVVEHRVAGAVGEGDPVELELPRDSLGTLSVGRRDHLRSPVEQLEDPLGGSHRLLQDVVLLRQVGERLVEALRVLQEGDQRADRDRAGQRLRAAEGEHQAEAEGGQDLHARVVHRVVEDAADVGVAMLGVDLPEARERRRLAAVELDDRHPRQVLLQERGEARHRGAHLAEAHPRPALEPDREQEEQRQDREGGERQPDVERDQHRGDPGEHQHVADDRDDAGGEQLVERVDVGGDPGHQPADRRRVEVGELEPLQVAEDVAPQVRHHPLTHRLEQVALRVERDEGHQQRRHVDRRRPADPGERRELDARRGEPVADPARDRRAGRPGLDRRGEEEVDRDRGGERADQLRRRGDQHQPERAQRQTPVRREIAQQTTHQAAVVGSAQRLFGRSRLELAHLPASPPARTTASSYRRRAPASHERRVR